MQTGISLDNRAQNGRDVRGSLSLATLPAGNKHRSTELRRFHRLGCILLACMMVVGCQSTDPSTASNKGKKSDAGKAVVTNEVIYDTGFEGPAALPTGWETAGDVSVDATGFEGAQSLKLHRIEADVLKPVYAVSPSFKVEQANYLVTLAARSDLVSPDNSFKGEVTIEYTDENGRPGQIVPVAELDKQQNWKNFKKDLGIPATIVSARFRVRIDKAHGSFWVDSLSIKPSTISSGDPVVDRIFFDTAQMGNLLFPTDKRTIKVTAWTLRELDDAERNIAAVVTDYWGAEQATAIPVTLEKTGTTRKTLHVYEGNFDLADVPLEIGRYYEIHATLNKSARDKQPAGTFSNYTSLAVLPYAPANRYDPALVPFTSRTWDARIDTAQYLNHRLGIRVGGVWGGWKQEPPYEPYAATIEVLEKQGMGFLTGSPAHDVEQRNARHEKWTDEALRAGVRTFIAKYGHIKPMIINLGNEPSNKGDDVKLNVKAYKSIYEEVKKIDPSIIVVGTSVGPSEDFFKAGFGNYLDAYDFHIYGDSGEVREAIEKQYPAMFAKYGNKKPIWSTELGFSSHGMARQQVVREMVKKTVNFFAAGGANMSWFGIMYPDPDAVIVGTGGESHNVFDCRYMKYAPKLDGISYYNVVNAVGVKKFVSEKVYNDEVYAFLFRDKNENTTFQAIYMLKGTKDIFVPLEGVDKVDVIRVDGTRSTLSAKGGGVTLTAGEDPLMLLYTGGKDVLPGALGSPKGTISQAAGAIVAGEGGRLDVAFSGDLKVSLKAPFGWNAKPLADKNISTDKTPTTAFSLISPANTTAREADIVVRLQDAQGNIVGELYDRPTVSGAISMNALPVPAVDGKPVGVKLAIRNNGKSSQKVGWSIEMLGAKPVMEGEYPDKRVATDAYFTEATTGDFSLDAGASRDVFVPLAKIDPHTAYFVKAIATDAVGRQVVDERPIAGFVAVPKVTADKIVIDGDLSDIAWQQATKLRVDKLEQFFNFRKPNRDKQWTGAEDLSADIRYLWDDQFLYVAVDVVDDIAGKPQRDGMIWSQDGLQFLVDPSRAEKVKAGRYDYGVARSETGLQAWNYLTADSAAAPSGEVTDFKIGIRKTKAGTGNMVYELAIPWSRLSPFKPAAGANLGFTLILNEDDGEGRDSFMTWFGNAHSKDIETVGDLVLMEGK